MSRVSRSSFARRLTSVRVVTRPQGWSLFVNRWGAVLLTVWFASHTFNRISSFVAQGFPVGIDAMIYYRGAVAWLHGGNPWDAAVAGADWSFHYVGTPATTVMMAPAAILSEGAFTAAWIVFTWLAAIWTLRRLGLPLWWLAFPPIAEALYSANPQLVILALLVANRSLASAIAIGLKVFAVIPLAGGLRWRQIALGVGLTAATILIAPNLWLDYLRSFWSISSRLAFETQQDGSVFHASILLGLTALALLLLAARDRQTAGWLTVPALWPSSQFHYSTLALPVMSPLLAVLLAIPGLSAQVVIILEVGRILIGPRVAQLWRSDRRPTFGRERPTTVLDLQAVPVAEDTAEPRRR